MLNFIEYDKNTQIYNNIYKSESMFVAVFVSIFVCMYKINSLTP
jgi:hypothetical protein